MFARIYLTIASISSGFALTRQQVIIEINARLDGEYMRNSMS